MSIVLDCVLVDTGSGTGRGYALNESSSAWAGETWQGVMIMKRFAKLGVLGALGIALAATAASAADLPPPPPVAPEAPPVFTWEHTIYAGIQLGYGIAYKIWDFGPGTESHTVRGLLAGAQLGINVQKNNFVYGGEVDVNWSNMTGSNACGPDTCTTDINWLATWTGKLGFDIGPIIYVEAGAAVAGESFSAPPSAFTGSILNFGWTVGAGVEFYVGNSWMVDLEYNYVNFGTNYVAFYDGLISQDFEVTQSAHLLRLGVSRTF